MGERDGVFAGEGFDGALVDRIALGSLVRLVPPDLVDEMVAAAGASEQRRRRLPARVVVYFVLALCLFFGDDYAEVLRKLVGALKKMGSWSDDWEFPSTGSLSKARARLGEQPLRDLFASVAVPIATPGMNSAFVRGFRLMALDATSISIPDTPGNAEAFGYGGNADKRSAFPKVRIAALAECGTHALIDATFDAYTTSEKALATRLAATAGPGMLVIMDAQSWGQDTWQRFTGNGTDLLWRIPDQHRFPVLRTLPDGSWLSVLTSPHQGKRSSFRKSFAAGRADPGDIEHWSRYGQVIRVIEYTVDNADKHETTRLITSITDPGKATAAELAIAYHERWEIEGAIDELKTHQKGPAVLLRSRSPEMIRQELWALLTTHYLIRRLMAETAQIADVDPDRLSFIRALRIIRRQVTDQTGFSP